MEKKQTPSGQEFYYARSVTDFVTEMDKLANGAKVILVNVSLQAVPEPENHPFGGVSQWYEVSDKSGNIILYWPYMMWQAETSGLTSEMKECGQFFAPALELENREGLGVQIIRIIKKQRAATEKGRVLGWLSGLLHKSQGALTRGRLSFYTKLNFIISKSILIFLQFRVLNASTVWSTKNPERGFCVAE